MELLLKLDMDAGGGEVAAIGYIGNAQAPGALYPVFQEQLATGKATRAATLRVPPGWWYKVEGFLSR